MNKPQLHRNTGSQASTDTTQAGATTDTNSTGTTQASATTDTNNTTQKNPVLAQRLGFFALLVLLTIIINQGFLWAASPRHLGPGAEVSQRIRALRVLDQEQPDTLDAVFFGDSSVMTAIDPNAIWRETGIPSADISTPAMDIMEAYRAFQKLVTTQHPKIAFLETSFFYYGGNLDGMRSLAKDQIGALLPVTRYHNTWRQVFKHEPESPLGTHGYTPYGGVVPYTGPADYMSQNTGYHDYSIFNHHMIAKIMQLAKENQIQIVFYSSPCPRLYTHAIHKALQDDANRYGVPYIDLNPQGQNPQGANHPNESAQPDYSVQLDLSQDILDGGMHLNATGAQKATASLINYLKTQNLPDHRGDSHYSAWEQPDATPL
ncbi:MAG: hypothetical protein SPK77_09670 [Lachnospiraceae bacterium]|nr:hypothetical protein [Lachnospiraceae bacterium]